MPQRPRSGKSLFSAWETGLLVVLLIAPFAIYKASWEEPYPAIIFPGGAGVVDIVDDRVEFEIRSFVGFDDADEPVYLDVTELLDPIPASHSGGVARNRFGMNDERTREVWVNLGLRQGTIEVPRYAATPEEKAEVREWLAGHLVGMGLQPDRFSVWYELVSVDYQTGRELSRELLREDQILHD